MGPNYTIVQIVVNATLLDTILHYRFELHAKKAEIQATKGAFFTSAFSGTTFFLGLGMFGAAFW